jgi:TorA maturation chaperone TorD
MPTQLSEPSTLQTAMARCRIYTFLAALMRYPDSALSSALDSPAMWLALDSAAAALPASDAELYPTLMQLKSASQDCNSDKLEAQYLKVFGSSPRGRVAAYECEYGNREIFQFASELADVSAFYNAFGMALAGGEERADHVSTECEFMALLCAKEVTALSDGDCEQHLQTAREAQHLFLRDHLCQWAPAFAHQVIAVDRTGIYGCAAALLNAMMALESAQFSLQCGPAYLPIRDVAGPDDPSNGIACAKQEGIPGAMNEAEG